MCGDGTWCGRWCRGCCGAWVGWCRVEASVGNGNKQIWVEFGGRGPPHSVASSPQVHCCMPYTRSHVLLPHPLPCNATHLAHNRASASSLAPPPPSLNARRASAARAQAVWRMLWCCATRAKGARTTSIGGCVCGDDADQNTATSHAPLPPPRHAERLLESSRAPRRQRAPREAATKEKKGKVGCIHRERTAENENVCVSSPSLFSLLTPSITAAPGRASRSCRPHHTAPRPGGACRPPAP